MLAWLSVCSEVQIACLGGCGNNHTKESWCSVASDMRHHRKTLTYLPHSHKSLDGPNCSCCLVERTGINYQYFLCISVVAVISVLYVV